MSHKTMVRIAILMVLVFGGMVVVYPLLFGPAQPGPTDTAPAPPEPPAN